MNHLRHPVLGCHCSEGWAMDAADGVLKPMPPVHDCAYIKRRNVAVAKALAIADKAIPDRRKEAADKKWTEMFQQTITDLMMGSGA